MLKPASGKVTGHPRSPSPHGSSDSEGSVTNGGNQRREVSSGHLVLVGDRTFVKGNHADA